MPIDHFRVRDILFVDPVTRDPSVAGQFQTTFKPSKPPPKGDFLPLLITGPQRLLVPTDKKVPDKPPVPRQSPADHLLWYLAASTDPDPEPKRRVTITNQFVTRRQMMLGNVAALLTPAFKGKLPSGKPPIPQTIDHYLVYHVREAGGTIRKKARLTDQFGGANFRVVVALYFGIPVIKLFDDKFTPKKGAPINPRDHLTFYTVRLDNDREGRGGKKDLADQFVKQEGVSVLVTSLLAVPTEKIDWSVLDGKSVGPR